jgi:hypothetical protein
MKNAAKSFKKMAKDSNDDAETSSFEMRPPQAVQQAVNYVLPPGVVAVQQGAVPVVSTVAPTTQYGRRSKF